MKCENSFMGAMDHARHRRSRRHVKPVAKLHFLKGSTEDSCDTSPKSLHHLKLDMERANNKGQYDTKERRSADTLVQVSLKQEIHQLKKQLQDQFAVRDALEKAIRHRSYSIDTSNDRSMPEPTKELITEIAVLEFEVTHLEKHLLSLYRKTLDHQVCTVSPITVGDTVRQSFREKSGLFHKPGRLDASSKNGYPESQSSRILLPQMSVTDRLSGVCALNPEEKLAGRAVHRSQTSRPQRSVCSSRMRPSEEKRVRAHRKLHSLPFTCVENDTLGVTSLVDYLGTRITDHVHEMPCKVSEDIVRCMGAIYCRLAEPSLVHHGLSSFSSMSASSPRYMGDIWSPGYKRESMRDARLVNPFRVEGLKEFSGSYNTMVEVRLLCRDKRRIDDVKDMIQNYMLLVKRLETVDPRNMRNAEKLAFWINIHNALVMHAYLEHGIPQNYMKKSCLLKKATYTIGGRTINADIIEGPILGCRIYRPGWWLRLLLSRRIKFTDGDEWQPYRIAHPEPLLHFALCSGSHSDPALHIYNSKRVMDQMEAAKDEYIRAAISIHKEQRILLPKMIDCFAKETSLDLQGMLDMVQRCLPESLQMVMQRCQQGRPHKIVEWVPYNFTFRYLLSRELTVHLTN